MLTLWNIARVAIAAVAIVAVAELAQRFPRVGAMILSLPLVSMLVYLLSWIQYRDLSAISNLAQETMLLLALSLPFFLPLTFSNQLGLGFWTAMALGIALASLTVGARFLLLAYK